MASVTQAENGARKFDFFGFLYQWGTIITICLLVGFFGLVTPSFLSPGNLINILRSISIVTVIAIGVSISLAVGGFDLSVAGDSVRAAEEKLASRLIEIWPDIPTGILRAQRELLTGRRKARYDADLEVLRRTMKPAGPR